MLQTLRLSLLVTVVCFAISIVHTLHRSCTSLSPPGIHMSWSVLPFIPCFTKSGFVQYICFNYFGSPLISCVAMCFVVLSALSHQVSVPQLLLRWSSPPNFIKWRIQQIC
eukprot:TRINITY_DN2433_c0_g1_i1.p2 TRINITY_DN2433_c0_g1~~TRINITY_DN2433_c0_g1_i1.p2  ORF type:complete len:110 (-),score=7.90 TRINITY_DN2433_c0_g1_i1:55-384(-)